jgi:hypothetical protein
MLCWASYVSSQRAATFLKLMVAKGAHKCAGTLYMEKIFLALLFPDFGMFTSKSRKVYIT